MDPDDRLCTNRTNRTKAMIENQTGVIPDAKESTIIHDLQAASDEFKYKHLQDQRLAEMQHGIEEMQRKEQETREKMAKLSGHLNELADGTCSFAESEYKDQNCSYCIDDDFMSDILDEDIYLEFIVNEDENEKAMRRLLEEMKECSMAADFILFQVLAFKHTFSKDLTNNPETQSKTEIATHGQVVELKTTEQLTKKELKKAQRGAKKKEKQEKKRQKKEAKLQKKERKQMEKQRKIANRKKGYMYQNSDEDANVHNKPRGMRDRARRFFGQLFCFTS